MVGSPVMEIANPQPMPTSGFGRLILGYAQLPSVMGAPVRGMEGSAVVGGRHLPHHRPRIARQYGAESIRQRWSAYAAGGQGVNVELLCCWCRTAYSSGSLESCRP